MPGVYVCVQPFGHLGAVERGDEQPCGAGSLRFLDGGELILHAVAPGFPEIHVDGKIGKSAERLCKTAPHFFIKGIPLGVEDHADAQRLPGDEGFPGAIGAVTVFPREHFHPALDLRLDAAAPVQRAIHRPAGYPDQLGDLLGCDAHSRLRSRARSLLLLYHVFRGCQSFSAEGGSI